MAPRSDDRFARRAARPRLDECIDACAPAVRRRPSAQRQPTGSQRYSMTAPLKNLRDHHGRTSRSATAPMTSSSPRRAGLARPALRRVGPRRAHRHRYRSTWPKHWLEPAERSPYRGRHSASRIIVEEGSVEDLSRLETGFRSADRGQDRAQRSGDCGSAGVVGILAGFAAAILRRWRRSQPDLAAWRR